MENKIKCPITRIEYCLQDCLIPYNLPCKDKTIDSDANVFCNLQGLVECEVILKANTRG